MHLGYEWMKRIVFHFCFRPQINSQKDKKTKAIKNFLRNEFRELPSQCGGVLPNIWDVEIRSIQHFHLNVARICALNDKIRNPDSGLNSIRSIEW